MPLIEKFTHGELSVSKALHWNEENYQKLGEIIKNLMSLNPEKERKGYIEYYNLKKHFISSEFEDKINELEKYRKEHRFPSIRYVLSIVKRYFFKENTQTDPQIPEYINRKEENMKSRITEITYSRVKNLGNHETVKVEAKAIVAEDEKPSEVIKKVKAWVKNQTEID